MEARAELFIELVVTRATLLAFLHGSEAKIAQELLDR
jgi:hypothetical protein